MKNGQAQKLVFVYNADSGFRNVVIDSLHKAISPKTYDCNLCDITFGVFTENKIWKKFRHEAQFEMEFLHKNEFRKQYASKFGYKFTFPIVLIESENGLEVLISTEEMNGFENAEELINRLTSCV